MNDYVYGPLLTVDPGVTGTGYAMWAEKANSVGSFATGLITPKSGAWMDRALFVLSEFALAVNNFKTLWPDGVVAIEDQAIWLDTAVSSTAAKSGDIVKLAQLTGMLLGCAHARGLRVMLVPVRKWKGQMSKDAVMSRIKRRLGLTYPDHIADAIGIGLYLRGAF